MIPPPPGACLWQAVAPQQVIGLIIGVGLWNVRLRLWRNTEVVG